MKTWMALIIVGLILLTISFLPWTTQEEGQGVIETAGGIDLVERGRALFMAKGCAGCHQHDEARSLEDEPPIGPNLTDYQSSAEFLDLWLNEPSSVRPDTIMPDLKLEADEIEALTAFLNDE